MRSLGPGPLAGPRGGPPGLQNAARFGRLHSHASVLPCGAPSDRRAQRLGAHACSRSPAARLPSCVPLSPPLAPTTPSLHTRSACLRPARGAARPRRGPAPRGACACAGRDSAIPRLTEKKKRDHKTCTRRSTFFFGPSVENILSINALSTGPRISRLCTCCRQRRECYYCLEHLTARERRNTVSTLASSALSARCL